MTFLQQVTRTSQPLNSITYAFFCNKCHPNWTANMDSIDRNSFRPLNKVKRNKTHPCWTNFCKELLYHVLLKLEKLLSHQYI
jgi:hypothetical protein